MQAEQRKADIPLPDGSRFFRPERFDAPAELCGSAERAFGHLHGVVIGQLALDSGTAGTKKKDANSRNDLKRRFHGTERNRSRRVFQWLEPVLPVDLRYSKHWKKGGLNCPMSGNVKFMELRLVQGRRAAMMGRS